MNVPETTPWLSILLPVYNVAPFLEECLLSIGDQIEDGVEVIALDDASTDGSQVLLEQLRRTRCPWLKTMEHSTNQGISTARNHLLAAARGTYVWFIDSDDIMIAGAVAAARRIIQENTPDMIGCNFIKRRMRITFKERLSGPRVRRTFEGPTGELITEREVLVHGVFRSGNLYAWARIFRRAIHPDPNLFPDGLYFEDAHAIPRLLLHVERYYHSASPWIIYRERAGSVMRTIDAHKAAHIGLSLRGLHGKFASCVQTMSLRTKYAVATFCTQMYVGSCRHMLRGDPSLFARHWAEVVSTMEQASPLSVGQLIGHYGVRPKRWWRAVKLLTWRYHPMLAHRLRM